MAIPSHCLITAPVARSLRAERGRTARVPDAVLAGLQLWDSLDADYWTALADPALTIYTSFAALPLPWKKVAVLVTRYDDLTATTGAAWKRWADCTILDFLKVVNLGIAATKTATTLIAGDRPVEHAPVHHWAGKPADTLGAP